MTYHSQYLVDSSFEIAAKVFRENGSALTSEFVVNQFTSGDQHYPDVVSFGNCSSATFTLCFIICFQGVGPGSGSQPSLYGQAYDCMANRISAQFAVQSDSSTAF